MPVKRCAPGSLPPRARSDAVEADERYYAAAADIERAEEVLELLHVDRRHGDAVECAVRPQQPPRELDRLLLADPPDDRRADIELVFDVLDLKLEVGTVADIDRGRHRPVRGLPDEARGAGNAKLHRHIAVRLVGLGPGDDVEIVGIALIGAAQRQQRAVGFADHAPDIFFEHPCQIAALADRILIGALRARGWPADKCRPTRWR